MEKIRHIANIWKTQANKAAKTIEHASKIFEDSEEPVIFLVLFVFFEIPFVLARVDNPLLVQVGFASAIVGIHEFCHVMTLKARRYQITGLTFSLRPPSLGILFEPSPLKREDATPIYLSSLWSLLPCLILVPYNLFFGLLWTSFTIIGCSEDIRDWRKVMLQKETTTIVR